jgi:hypothetical protein
MKNPVRAALCAHEEDYRWSSARLYLVEGIARKDGLDLGMALKEFGVEETDLSVATSLGTGRAEA